MYYFEFETELKFPNFYSMGTIFAFIDDHRKQFDEAAIVDLFYYITGLESVHSDYVHHLLSTFEGKPCSFIYNKLRELVAFLQSKDGTMIRTDSSSDRELVQRLFLEQE